MTDTDWRSQAQINQLMLDLFASLVIEMREAQKGLCETYDQYNRMVELEHRIDEWITGYVAGKGKTNALRTYNR